MSNLVERFKDLENEDVAIKRIEMYSIFQEILQKESGKEDSVEGLNEIKDSNGYLFKLSQDFLLASSTMKKEQKLEKIITKFTQ